MATRASNAQKPTGVTASRAASSSGHGSSGTDSNSSGRHCPESGRDRRRRGKLKMQQRIHSLDQQLAAAASRVSDLEKRNHCLSLLVEELTRRLTTTSSHTLAELPPNTSPVLFDVYDLEEDIATVGCQTVISVPHQQEDLFCVVDNSGYLIPLRSNAESTDIFVRVQDLPVCAAECHIPPQCAAGSLSQPHATAHADAAAGVDAAHAKLTDFQSRDLAHTAVPFATAVKEQGTAKVFEDKLADSQCLAISAVGDLAQQHVAHVPLDTRQALDVDYAKHRVPGTTDEPTTHNRLRNLTSISQDFTQQHLAPSVGPDAAGEHEQPQAGLAQTDALAKRYISGLFESNSQNLAVSTQCGHSFQGLAPHASHQNFNSQNLAHSPQPCAFQACELSARPSATIGGEQCETHQLVFKSQDLANSMVSSDDLTPPQCVHNTLVPGLRLALDGVNSEHRYASGRDHDQGLRAQMSVSLDHNPQHMQHALEKRQALEAVNSEHRTISDKDEPRADPAHTQCGHLSTQCGHSLLGSVLHESLLHFNSQTLAQPPQQCALGACELSSRPSATAAREQCETHQLVSQSQDLAMSSESLADLAPPQCVHSSLESGIRLALDDVNSEHRNASGREHNHRLRDQMSISQDNNPQHVPRALDKRVELEADNSEHRSASASKAQCPEDFNSHNLAHPPKPCAFGAAELSARPAATRQCSPHQLDFKSHDLANSSQSLGDLVPTQCGRSSLDPGLRQALDDVNSEHRDTSGKGHDPGLRDQMSTSVDNNLHTPEHLGDAQCLRQALDVANSEHRSTGACESVILDGPCASLSQCPADSASSAVKLSFGPSERQPQLKVHCATAVTDTADASLGLIASGTPGDVQPPQGSCLLRDQNVLQTQPVPRDFVDILDSILAVYGKKKKITKNILDTTTRAIHRVSCKHGVAKEACIGLVKERSLALTCALDSFWTSP